MKKSIGLLLFLVTNVAFATQHEKLHVGDYYQGGVIYWLDPTEVYHHGLIADVKDAPNASGYAWDTNPPSETKARNEKFFAGKTNTQTIIAAIGSERAQAANACASSHSQGYSDWYLPAKMELAELLSNKKIVANAAKHHAGGAFSNSPYWSSTEFRLNSAWNISRFPTGGVHDTTYKKNIAIHVRCIRAF